MSRRPHPSIGVTRLVVATLLALAAVLTGCGASTESGPARDQPIDDAIEDPTTIVDGDAEPGRSIETLVPVPDAEVAAACVEQPTGEPPAFDGVGVLVDADGVAYCLGPALAIGIESAAANIALAPVSAVEPILTTTGIDTFNALAAECFQEASLCPTGRVAIIVDDVVLTAPQINADRFERDQLVISGTFDPDEAERLASAMAASAQLEVRPVLVDLGPDLDNSSDS